MPDLSKPSILTQVLSVRNLNGNFREVLPYLTIGTVLDAIALLKRLGALK